MSTQTVKGTADNPMFRVSMRAITREMEDVFDDSKYIKDVYFDMVAYLKQHVESGSRVFTVSDMKFKPKFNVPALHLHLLTKYDEDQIDMLLLIQLLTIYSLLENKEIPQDCFCVTFEFPMLYLIVTGRMPDGTA